MGEMDISLIKKKGKNNIWGYSVLNEEEHHTSLKGSTLLTYFQRVIFFNRANLEMGEKKDPDKHGLRW